MKQDKIAVHERAINLARRYSVQNENDLMQVSQNGDRPKDTIQVVAIRTKLILAVSLFSVGFTGGFYGYVTCLLSITSGSNL